MTNTAKHAETEIDILIASAKKKNDEAIIAPFKNEILALCEAFGNSGQSGGSAPFVAGAISKAIKKLLLFQPLCPLTNLDEEWMEVAEDCFQNNRLSSVFKNSKTGKPYFLNAIVWCGDTVGENGSHDWDTFTGMVEGITSRQYIKSFPFEPKTFYIDVTRVKYDSVKHKDARVVTTGLDGDVVYLIKDRKQLDEVWAYYDRYQ